MVNKYSWDSFQKPEVQEELVQEQPEEELKKDPESDLFKEDPYDWGDFYTPTSYQKKDENEPTDEILLRVGASNLARIAETAAGREGDIINFVQDTVKNNPKAGGLLGYALHELMGEENWQKMFQKDPETLGIHPPATEDFRNWTKETFKGKLEPKGKTEKRINDLTSDVTTMIRGRGLPTMNRQSLFNNFGIPAAANIVKGTVEDLGFGEDYGNWAKVGTWIGLGLMNNVNARHYATDRVYQGRNAFDDTVRADPQRYSGMINRLRNMFLPDDVRSSAALQQISAIEDDIANGRLTIAQLMNRFDAINALKQDRGMFNLPRTQRRVAIRNLDRVKSAVGDEIRNIGEPVNPEAYANWNEGMKSLAVINQSEAISNFVNTTLSGKYAKALSGPLTAMFGVGAYGSFKSPMVSGAGAGATALGYKAGQIGYRVLNDRNLARYYWRAVSEAQRGNEQAFINTYKQLERSYNKKHGKEDAKKEAKSIKSSI